MILQGVGKVRLIGNVDLNGSDIRLANIAFIAPPEGSGSTGTECKAVYNGTAQINRCVFYGYDVAIETSAKGITSTRDSIYINNTIAFRFDLDGWESGSLAMDWCKNTFINNGIAVQILSLHKRISSYYFRIYDSNFINNGIDFDAQCGGTLYLYQNYFGEFDKKNKPNGNNKLPLSELLGATTEGQVDQIVKRRKAMIANERENKDTKVITNPRWKFPVMTWWSGRSLEPLLFDRDVAITPAALFMSLYAEKPYTNILLVDWENDTQIPNEEADGLLIDNSAFDESGNKKIDIVEGEQEIYLGTWIFD